MDRWDEGSEELFLQTAESIEGLITAPEMRGLLKELYHEYCKRIEEGDFPQSVTVRDPNDEDTDDPEVTEFELLPWDFSSETEESELREEVKKADPLIEQRVAGAEQQLHALREVTDEAKRILNELNEALSKVKPEQTVEYREMRTALAQVAAMDGRQSPAEAQMRLAELEEVSYTSMVGKKGWFGILSGVQQKLQEITKESWALAGQAQVDLDIAELPQEDQRSLLDPKVPLQQQLHRGEEGNVLQNAGRLQRLVRFDDLQADLSTQHTKRKN